MVDIIDDIDIIDDTDNIDSSLLRDRPLSVSHRKSQPQGHKFNTQYL